MLFLREKNSKKMHMMHSINMVVAIINSVTNCFGDYGIIKLGIELGGVRQAQALVQRMGDA